MAGRSTLPSLVAIRRALKVVRRPVGSAATTINPSKRPYTGILAEPMSFKISPFLESRPHWYPGDDSDWAAEVEPVIAREDAAWRERLIALGRWYGIELDQDPHPFDRYHRLVFELAEAHVPAFDIAEELGARLPGKGAPPVLGGAQIIRFAACVHDALAAGLNSDGAIAARVRSRVEFTVPRRGRSPRKVAKPARVPLTRQTATHLVKLMRSGWRDVLGGTASAYQFHVVTLALVSEQGYDMVPNWAVVFGFHSAK
jgi:hypothetical protein